MDIKRTTHVPNILFDEYMRSLNLAELKILLLIIRQTYGWVDTKTGGRKVRDRISHSQFMSKSGLSRRIISDTVQHLIIKQLIAVTDTYGKDLNDPKQRKGRQYLFYQTIFLPVHCTTETNAKDTSRPVQNMAHNKTKNNNKTKVAQYAKAILEIVTSVSDSMQP
jgi:hypothetical protein